MSAFTLEPLTGEYEDGASGESAAAEQSKRDSEKKKNEERCLLLFKVCCRKEKKMELEMVLSRTRLERRKIREL